MSPDALRELLDRHPVNVETADVPGPPLPLFLAGARVLEVFPLLNLIGNVSLGVGALSYAGAFGVMVVAENALLLACGLATGTLCALLAIAPVVAARGGRLPVASLGMLLAAVVAAGFAASVTVSPTRLCRTSLTPVIR